MLPVDEGDLLDELQLLWILAVDELQESLGEFDPNVHEVLPETRHRRHELACQRAGFKADDLDVLSDHQAVVGGAGDEAQRREGRAAEQAVRVVLFCKDLAGEGAVVVGVRVVDEAVVVEGEAVLHGRALDPVVLVPHVGVVLDRGDHADALAPLLVEVLDGAEACVVVVDVDEGVIHRHLGLPERDEREVPLVQVGHARIVGLGVVEDDPAGEVRLDHVLDGLERVLRGLDGDHRHVVGGVLKALRHAGEQRERTDVANDVGLLHHRDDAADVVVAPSAKPQALEVRGIAELARRLPHLFLGGFLDVVAVFQRP